MNIGQAVKQVRKTKGMTQVTFCKKLGITQTYLSQVESGAKANPSMALLNKVSKISNVPLSVIMWLSVEEKDIAKDKRKIFVSLKPSIDNLIKEIL